jgi:hypothetical protein
MYLFTNGGSPELKNEISVLRWTSETSLLSFILYFLNATFDYFINCPHCVKNCHLNEQQINVKLTPTFRVDITSYEQ